MADWRKTQYRTDLPQDPNSDLEDAAMTARVLVPVALAVLAIAFLGYWLLTL